MNSKALSTCSSTLLMILCRQFVSILMLTMYCGFLFLFVIVFSSLKKGFGYETIRCLIDMKSKPCLKLFS